jgi:hypothetical protein
MPTSADAASVSARIRLELDNAHVAYGTVVFFCTFGGNALRNAIGWWGWAAAVLVALVVAVTWIVRSGNAPTLLRLPAPLLAFCAFALASAAWAHWPLESLLGAGVLWTTVLVAFPLGVMLSWRELVVALSGALRWIVALSYAFELFVSLVVRHPVLPVFVDWVTWEDAPLQVMWSRDLLFETGKIQGIVGNSSVLAGVAAFGLVALVVQFRAGLLGRGWTALWVLVLGGTLVLTGSATMAVALAATAVVLVLVLVRRAVGDRFAPRVIFAAAAVLALAAAATLTAVFWQQLLSLFGKSPDLTGRFEIWRNTIDLAVQRPWFGWGWLGYWPPWVEPLAGLNERYDVVQLHAHDAWIDLWMQVGIVGLAIFAVLVLVTVWRAWRAAITPERDALTGSHAFSALSLLPILVLTLLLVQSITESRLIIEEGVLTLAALAMRMKLRPFRGHAGPGRS